MNFVRYTGGEFSARDREYEKYEKLVIGKAEPPTFEDFLDEVADEVRSAIDSYVKQFKMGTVSESSGAISWQSDGLIVNYSGNKIVPEHYLYGAVQRAWGKFRDKYGI